MARSRFLPDNFTLALIATVALASVLPAAGRAARGFEYATTAAVALLFFLHGAKLSRQAIVAGLSHWRLHLVVIASTFVLFPLIGWALRPVLEPLVTPELYMGVIFLCVLPATVQSAIAFTAMARGNMPAAICSASGSTLLGIVITPLLVGLLLKDVPGAQSAPGAAGGHDTLASIGRITVQLFVPFLAGHLLRPWIGGFVQRRAAVLKFVDQGSILLVVYTAFSAAVIEGLWREIPLHALAGLVAVCAVILAVALVATTWISRRMGFSKEDEITVVFCGSKKSLASGVPMAKVLFASHAVGALVLPLMVFHQMQLMVCAVIAQRYARRPAEGGAVEGGVGASGGTPPAARP
ncbi:bile acid:sodium symporter [Paracidovorax avenae]|uniref:bile acid:sodium symporter family protein n=3 Tax=Burkholderiales TaxID=80840 RepID=UPI000D15D147|nr:bile acid:sodium symporter family protein [Paracidovorax avenae]AVS78549.1 bile acid:sodium symporter [Paracidovorax avenae]AVS94062.1 bile acid:sodium symporter [Paracidovorax avenae]AVT06827.1 bile acid:sodium symporter [Paracidovorax avenae]AVT17246.1 bile acid:sodium symporter [Paracidovorax avenae]